MTEKIAVAIQQYEELNNGDVIEEEVIKGVMRREIGSAVAEEGE